MKRLLFTTILSALCGMAAAQCPDFTDLTAPGVECRYGTAFDPLADSGRIDGRHTVITTQGTDPRTGNLLPLLPPGESRVIKLGNEQVGAEGEGIAYTFTVDPDYAILLLKFAVVLEDPGHPNTAQPRFVVRVLDSRGQLVEECAEYDVSAAGDIPGFQTAYAGWRCVRWRPWTSVGIDLTDLIGQTATVQFITCDCQWYGHFGYAYFTGSCISSKLALTGCEGDMVTLSAPEGFESYQWDNGAAGQTAQYPVVAGGTHANCLITSATGCQFTLNAFVSNQANLPAQGTIIYDTICEGDGYTWNYFDLPPQNATGTFTHRNSFYDPVSCSGDITTTLFLTVLQKYYDIDDAACEGEEYRRHGFHVANPVAGTCTYTRTATSPNGCDSVITLHLTVNPSFHLPNQIAGETHPCENETCMYHLTDGDNLTTFHWMVPAGARIVSGQGTPSISLYFTDCTQDTLFLLGENGCGSGSLPLVITPNPAYHLLFADTVCTGSEYHGNGFDLSRQDSTGYCTFINRYHTAAGCDSVRILTLWVFTTPEIGILAQHEVLCAGEEADLHAMGSEATVIAGDNPTPPVIAVGDILCSNGNIVKLDSFDRNTDTAMGIVFYVDNTGKHGWAAALHDCDTLCLWGPHSSSDPYTISDDIPGSANYTSPRAAITDIDGMANTVAIRNYYGNNFVNCAAACKAYNWNHVTNSVDTVHNGWYLPAAGQLNHLFAEIYTVNTALNLVGGTQVLINQNFWYWSSSELSFMYAWGVNDDGGVGNHSKNLYYKARSVRSF